MENNKTLANEVLGLTSLVESVKDRVAALRREGNYKYNIELLKAEHYLVYVKDRLLVVLESVKADKRGGEIG